MSLTWDKAVVPEPLLAFVRKVQEGANCRLSGGAVLSGVHLRHRLSKDLDIFCDKREDVREVLACCHSIAADSGGSLVLVRDGGSFVRGHLKLPSHEIELDIAHEPSIPLAPRDVVEGIVVDSLSDLQANKITCLLSRAEPRDLVDLYFLDRKEKKPETFLQDALQKYAGIDPAILSHILKGFPVGPLPVMWRELDADTLAKFRDELVRRFRNVAVGVT
jgi:hypothetical protein